MRKYKLILETIDGQTHDKIVLVKNQKDLERDKLAFISEIVSKYGFGGLAHDIRVIRIQKVRCFLKSQNDSTHIVPKTRWDMFREEVCSWPYTR